MSEEEWSLKDKGQVIDYWHDGEDDNYELRRIHERFNEEPEAYLASDIRTLYKKIYDLVRVSMNTDENPKWVLKQINKLFGME